jgi:hypothetical protein
MKKKLIILITSVILFALLLNTFIFYVDEYIKPKFYHIIIYNLTNERIEILVNNNYSIFSDGKTQVLDKMYDNNIENRRSYFIKVKNGNKILIEKKLFTYSDECSTYSATGGFFTYIIIKKIGNDYNLIFTTMDSDITTNEKLRFIWRKKIIDYFDFNGLNI